MRLVILALSIFLALCDSSSFAADPNPRVKELQRGLADLGYEPGPPDGIVGPKTREAIVAFEKDHGLPIDGQYSGLLLLNVQMELSIAREEATPEGQQRKQERETLLAMSNDELMRLIDAADKNEMDRIANLIGERVTELPARWLLEKTGFAATVFDTTVSLVLGGLHYPEPPIGVSEFQRDIGAEETGALTLAQFQELGRRHTRYRDTPVYVPGLSDVRVLSGSGWISAEGTWIIEGEQIAYPINVAEISCMRDFGLCMVAQASLVVPKVDEGDDRYLLTVRTETYEVVSWGADEVVARGSGTCRTTLLTLNTNSNEVYEITRNNETELCQDELLSLPKLDKPRIARLIPGWDITREFWKKRREITQTYASSGVRDRVKQLNDTTAPSQ